jgi:TolB-like protein/DNA-binding winged helix-turn-helix (wHTH) protein/rhodanese-related sulfurtransferase
MESAELEFGQFILDTRRRELRLDDKPVPLDLRAFEVLAFLILHRDRAVSRDEILANVWPNLTVSPGNVSVQIHAVRKALEQAGGDPQLIKTLPRQCYQFIGDLREPQTAAREGQDTSLVPPRRRLRLLAASIGLVGVLAGLLVLGTRHWPARPSGAPRLSIVVLPFQNRSPDRDQDYLADAVTDDLTTELARIPGSTVIARETAEIYGGRATPANEIGRALNVRYLLQGHVAPGDNILHVDAELTDTTRNIQIWGTRFDIMRERTGDTLNEIVNRLATDLDLELVQVETSRLLRDRPDNLDAMDLFFRARSIMDRVPALSDYQQAQSLLEKAIAQQPDFADALAELGWVLVCKLTEVDDPAESVDQAEAKSVIARALAVSPNNTRALSAQSRLSSIEGDYAAAAASARAALALDPNSTDAYVVLVYAEFYQGHLDEAAAALQATLRLNPEGPSSKTRLLRLGMVRLYQGHATDAIGLLQKASAGDVDPEPGKGQWGPADKARFELIAAYQLAGDTDHARKLYADYAQRWLHRTVWRVGALVPQTLIALPGFSRFLAALTQAGMPMFADEYVDDHVDPNASPLTGDMFAPTPTSIPNAATIDTKSLLAMVKDSRPKLIIDVGTGTSVIDGAAWVDTAGKPGGDDAFAETCAQRFTIQNAGRPIVVMGDGTYGVGAYNAALHLVDAGYKNIYWYRGGEEAWAKAGLKGVYRRRD